MEQILVMELQTNPQGIVVGKLPITLNKRRWDKRAQKLPNGLWKYPFSQNLFEMPQPPSQSNKSPTPLQDIEMATLKDARNYLIAMHGLAYNEVRSEKNVYAVGKSLGINFII